MTASDRQSHWQTVYLTKGEQQVSWSQADPQPSLRLIESVAASRDASIVDVGGGASRLVDALLTDGFHTLTVLDISDAALTRARERLGAAGEGVRWIARDATLWQPEQVFDVWHDRAAFHFLVEEADRSAYLDRLNRGVRPGGHAVVGTFALDGPEKCSGLPVQRYDSVTLSRTIGPAFELVAQEPHRHVTPWGATQSFQFSVLRRK
ncbi:class I SAM-dependent methyltransferase [Bradyrhizobium sp. ISRA443]|uniref:class I SAM-dependent methyltransferase n=1 Tax=unclassified Bradyrhizobium TaxID=2631580 RepID=UPI0024791710|nr:MULTISPECIES: class I SAM-dependent methyltransferase [unclassified Bradyrhizobium]WGR93805.1 class I SAM-dependent methyltransferase [Bradyrhizobium sp. ISRA435]WGR98410.1 class I SAM-dependent methyltransferase [Bradyrhizobium sp. ISRA436]WGS05299.1 class I SAM-dependent methyltransferase [Bradyrhizobium sp. ISRA437]WGS12185.1 class I SAM-dependent methyltransferase [Bradyrhizobium sp. ISRA443]